MKNPRLLRVLAIATFGTAAAHAAPVLRLRTPCFSSVTISADAGLSNQIAAVTDAPAHLTFVATDTMALVQGTRCDRSEEFTVRVRPGTDIVIAEGGSTDYAVHGVGGALTATLGSGDLTDDYATTASLRMLSSGDVDIKTLDGNLTVESDSAGDVHIGQVVHARTASIALRSNGDAVIDGGHFDTLSATTYGSGDIAVHGTAVTAALGSYGNGDVHLDRVTHALSRRTFGSGSVVVTDTDGARISDDSAVGTVPPVPPVPPAPAMDNDGGSGGGAGLSVTPGGIVLGSHDRHHHTIAQIIATLIGTVALLIVFLVVVLVLLPILWRVRGRVLFPKVAPGEDSRVIRLSDDLSSLETRLARLEQYVTSQDFDLRRQLRALER